jgi:chromosome partitioning protein
MKTIVIANQKGGSGKFTSTFHLAVAAEHAGDGPALISDTDPQGSTGDWFNQRKKSGIEAARYAPLTLSDLPGYVRALKDAGAGYLIDNAPANGGVNPELFAIADMILIPLNPTPTDLRALVKGLPVIKRSRKPFNFMLARVRPNLRNNNGVTATLEALGLVLPVRRHERVIYAESSEQAAPMPGAVQRVATSDKPTPQLPKSSTRPVNVKTGKNWRHSPSKCRPFFANGSTSVPSMRISS